MSGAEVTRSDGTRRPGGLAANGRQAGSGELEAAGRRSAAAHRRHEPPLSPRPARPRRRDPRSASSRRRSTSSAATASRARRRARSPRRPSANLAAIVYHFGSKEALHVAVAEYIVGAHRRAGRAERSPPPAHPEAAATPEAARAALVRLLETYVDVILGAAEAERWARFIVREQMQPTAAFDVIYRSHGRRPRRSARGSSAPPLGRSRDDEAVRLSVFTMMGQILVFRVAADAGAPPHGLADDRREASAPRSSASSSPRSNAILDDAVLP